MSEDPTIPAASGGLDTINPPKALDGAAVAMEAAGISRSLIDDGEGSVPHVDIATLPKTDSPRPLPKENATLLFTEHDDDGSLGVVGSMQKPAAVAKQEVDMDKKLSGPQDKSVEMPAGADNEPVNEATMTAWPGNDASMDAAPESNDNGSQDVNGVESPYNSDAAFSESPTTTSEYDRSSEMLATTTPSTTSPMEYTTSENPTTTTSSTSELPQTTTTPTPSTSSEVPTTTIPSDNE